MKGVILHVTENDKIVGIEMLEASSKIPLMNLFNLRLDRHEKENNPKGKSIEVPYFNC